MLTRNGKKTGAGTGPLFLMTQDIARGTIVVGTPGSGKTFAMKQIVENFCDLSSMRHVIIFDVKGDWVQMLQSDLEEDDSANEALGQQKKADLLKVRTKFHRRCHVRLMTFGTDHGWPATLDPFPLQLDAREPGRDSESILYGKVRMFVKDILASVGLIKTNHGSQKGKESLALNYLPALIERTRGQSSTTADRTEDKQTLATDLSAAAWQVNEANGACCGSGCGLPS